MIEWECTFVRRAMPGDAVDTRCRVEGSVVVRACSSTPHCSAQDRPTEQEANTI